MKKNKIFLLFVVFFIISCSETSFIINSAKRLSNYTKDPNYKVGKPYKVNGQWFYPAVNYNYDEVGLASWYGPNFHGKKTANGEIFDQNIVSAAHKTLPMPSIVRVTNLENDKVLEIRINDRGPFVRRRIIDLSKKAAEILGVIKSGTAKVRVQIIEDKSRKIAMDYEEKIFISDAGMSDKIEKKVIEKQSLSNKQIKPVNLSSKKTIESNEKYNTKNSFKKKILVQVGAFNDIRNANSLKKKLIDFKAFIEREFVKEKYLYRVRIGPMSEISFAEKIIKKLDLLGFSNSEIILKRIK